MARRCQSHTASGQTKSWRLWARESNLPIDLLLVITCQLIFCLLSDSLVTSNSHIVGFLNVGDVKTLLETPSVWVKATTPNFSDISPKHSEVQRLWSALLRESTRTHARTHAPPETSIAFVTLSSQHS